MIRNEFADALATLSSMIHHPDKNYIDPIEVEIRVQHAYYFHADEDPDGKPWYHYIKKFLATREYLENVTNGQKRALKRLADHVLLNGEVLYRRTPDLEVQILSLRVIQEAKLDDAKWIRVRQEQLMFIDEKRMDAVCHG
nr:uncharacterized protein LOC104094576 [Nicotiana tomentosiformis]